MARTSGKGLGKILEVEMTDAEKREIYFAEIENDKAEQDWQDTQ